MILVLLVVRPVLPQKKTSSSYITARDYLAHKDPAADGMFVSQNSQMISTNISVTSAAEFFTISKQQAGSGGGE